MSNPFIRKNFKYKATAKVTSEANIPGSKSKLVGHNGEFNAYNKKDLAKVVASTQKSISSGDMINPNSYNRAALAKRVAFDNKDLIVAATRTNNSDAMMAVGGLIEDVIKTAGDREGLADNMLVNKTLGQGDMCRFEIDEKQVTGFQAVGPEQVAASEYRQGYTYPREFYVPMELLVEEKEIQQAPSDLLEKVLNQGLEQGMVVMDRIMKKVADANTVNSTIYYNTFTPGMIQKMRVDIGSYGLPVGNIVLAFDLWEDMVNGAEWGQFLDQITKHELVMQGSLGSIMGVNIITDGMREPKLRVLNDGDVYTFAQANYLGYTSRRGDIVPKPIDKAVLGLPYRGWYLNEIRSLDLPVGRGIAKCARL